MTDLTKQWKKGELPECEYYILDKEGNTSTMHLWNDERCKLSVRCKRLSILAPVPSYDEWKAKLEENARLKELLKGCLEVLEMVQGETIYFPRTVDECIDKINEVLK